MDRLDAMAAFIAVAELQGFAPAARRLRISPSAITRLVAALEEHLSIRLLQRTTRSVTLTDAGTRYLENARRIVAAVDDAEGAARAERTEPFGRFVVTAPVVFGRKEVSPLMSEFLRTYPAVTGVLTLADRMVNLVEEGVDLAVRIGVLEDSTLRARVVGKTRRLIVGSPAYLDKRRRPRKPSDLERHSIIQFTGLNQLPEWRFSSGREDERIAFRPTFVTNSADAAIVHAEQGGGLAMVLAYQVADLVQGGKLEVVLAKFEPPPLPIQLVYPAARLASANLRTFIELVQKTSRWNFADV